MGVEALILGGDDRLTKQRRDLIVGDDDAPLGGELADHLAVGRIDAGDRARRVVVERRNLRHVAAGREQQTADAAGHRGDHEERHDAGPAGDANDARQRQRPNVSASRLTAARHGLRRAALGGAVRAGGRCSGPPGRPAGPSAHRRTSTAAIGGRAWTMRGSGVGRVRARHRIRHAVTRRGARRRHPPTRARRWIAVALRRSGRPAILRWRSLRRPGHHRA